MGNKKIVKRKNDDGKKPESFNPAHKQGDSNSNYKKKERIKKNKGK